MATRTPTVNIDVDNTLAIRDVEETCRRINARYPDANLTPEQFTQWNFDVTGTDGKGIGTLINELLTEDDSYIMGMEPFKGAVDLARELHDEGVEVQIVTHRPAETHDWTKAWLAENDVPYSSFVEDVPSNKAEVPGEILIDDHHRNVADMASAGKTGVLVLHPYNHHSVPEMDGVVTPDRAHELSAAEIAERPACQWGAIRELVWRAVRGDVPGGASDGTAGVP